MAKTRGVEVTKEGGKWTWFVDGNRWELRREPYKDRRLVRCGVVLLGPMGLGKHHILCPDDAVLWSFGHEHALPHNREGGDAA